MPAGAGQSPHAVTGRGFPVTGVVVAIGIVAMFQLPYELGMEFKAKPKAWIPSRPLRMKRMLFALAFLPSVWLAAKQDAKSIAEIRAKAEQGDTLALDKLGLYHLHGDGVPKDITEGVRLIRLAAEQGNVVAQQNLGVFYQKGIYGLPKDGAEAVKWYGLAVEQGSTKVPHYILGKMYATGDGVPKNEIEALARFMLATGVEGAGAERSRMKRLVGPDGVQAAKKRSEAIRADIKARKTKGKASP